MVKRFFDSPYYTFSFWSDIIVACPKCEKAGVVRCDKEHNIAVFQCKSCYIKKETIPGQNDAAEVTAQCTSTGEYFRTWVANSKIHGQKVRVKCSCCRESVIGSISYDEKPQYLVFQDIRNAKDPYFHYPLYFQASYRRKIIWALNREYLQYLIDYLTADIRAVSFDFYDTYKTVRTQSDVLPTFIKTAKNRDGIVKLLSKLQKK